MTRADRGTIGAACAKTRGNITHPTKGEFGFVTLLQNHMRAADSLIEVNDGCRVNDFRGILRSAQGMLVKTEGAVTAETVQSLVPGITVILVGVLPEFGFVKVIGELRSISRRLVFQVGGDSGMQAFPSPGGLLRIQYSLNQPV